ncbi:MAG: NADH:flavin oxidoreductase/NADH oxidase [Jiangellales bacterium]
MSLLFSPLTLRATTVANRVWVSPMCQYSSIEGHPTDWHLAHLGALARGGAGLVMTEATAVTAEGRISPDDAGIWTGAQAADYARIVRLVRGQGAVPAIQLAHAGRKASTHAPWKGRGYVPSEDGGWQTVGPSPLGFGDWPAPASLTATEITALVEAFAEAAARAVAVGFEVVEVHAAHGYLIHQFLSPLSNQRRDEYGGSWHNRTRLLREVCAAVRATWPDDKPVFVRLSATDWVEGGWSLPDTVAVAAELAEIGVDLIDVSSGGLSPAQQITPAPGYQVPFAAAVRHEAGVATSAVGLITESAQAEQVLADGSADAVMLARALLRDPHWPLRAAAELGEHVPWPPQYERARWG